MNLYAKPLAPVWLIIKADCGSILGTNDRFSESGLEFGARVPLFLSNNRGARAIWRDFCIRKRYVQRSVSLPGKPAIFIPGPNFDLMPMVRLQKVDMERTDFELINRSLEVLNENA